MILEVYNEAGQLVIAYKIYRCWVSEFQALPDLDANANAVAIQTIKLENEGWERDTDVGEPTPSQSSQPDARSRCDIGRWQPPRSPAGDAVVRTCEGSTSNSSTPIAQLW